MNTAQNEFIKHFARKYIDRYQLKVRRQGNQRTVKWTLSKRKKWRWSITFHYVSPKPRGKFSVHERLPRTARKQPRASEQKYRDSGALHMKLHHRHICHKEAAGGVWQVTLRKSEEKAEHPLTYQVCYLASKRDL